MTRLSHHLFGSRLGASNDAGEHSWNRAATRITFSPRNESAQRRVSRGRATACDLKSIVGSLIVIVLCCLGGGCSVYAAAHQPGKRDLSVLDPGTPRSTVISVLGAPVYTENRDAGRTDLFAFTQGFTDAHKAIRAAGHGVADVFTFGLWEVVGTPVEAIWSGTDVRLKVHYRLDDRVESIEVLKGGKVVYREIETGEAGLDAQRPRRR